MLIAVLVMLLMLFVPGSLAFVAAGIPTCASLALSPIVVTAWLGVAGVVYALVGIPANPLTVLVPLTVACLLAAILFTAPEQCWQNRGGLSPCESPCSTLPWEPPYAYSSLSLEALQQVALSNSGITTLI